MAVVNPRPPTLNLHRTLDPPGSDLLRHVRGLGPPAAAKSFTGTLSLMNFNKESARIMLLFLFELLSSLNVPHRSERSSLAPK